MDGYRGETACVHWLAVDEADLQEAEEVYGERQIDAARFSRGLSNFEFFLDGNLRKPMGASCLCCISRVVFFLFCFFSCYPLGLSSPPSRNSVKRPPSHSSLRQTSRPGPRTSASCSWGAERYAGCLWRPTMTTAVS